MPPTGQNTPLPLERKCAERPLLNAGVQASTLLHQSFRIRLSLGRWRCSQLKVYRILINLEVLFKYLAIILWVSCPKLPLADSDAEK